MSPQTNDVVSTATRIQIYIPQARDVLKRWSGSSSPGVLTIDSPETLPQHELDSLDTTTSAGLSTSTSAAPTSIGVLLWLSAVALTGHAQ